MHGLRHGDVAGDQARDGGGDGHVHAHAAGQPGDGAGGGGAFDRHLGVEGLAPAKRQAEAEGLDRIVRDAGLEWADSGCSMCVGMNGDRVPSGQRCASTTNRNFRGRQGPGARTHLMSPAMVAAAAVTGRLTDVRALRPMEG